MCEFEERPYSVAHLNKCHFNKGAMPRYFRVFKGNLKLITSSKMVMRNSFSDKIIVSIGNHMISSAIWNK